MCPLLFAYVPLPGLHCRIFAIRSPGTTVDPTSYLSFGISVVIISFSLLFSVCEGNFVLSYYELSYFQNACDRDGGKWKMMIFLSFEIEFGNWMEAMKSSCLSCVTQSHVTIRL